MAKAATIKKPVPAAAAKPAVALKKPAAAAKPAAAKPAAKPKAPTKPQKPFEDRDIVIFKGYAPIKDAEGKDVPVDMSDKIFTPEQELAVVSERQDENGRTFVACVAVGDYHKYQADPESVNGEELMPSEIKRTSKKVEDEYSLVLVGNMEEILGQDEDPLEVARVLFNRASESFFYFGGVLSKLTRERDENGAPLFAGYVNPATGEPYGVDGYEQFLVDNFGETFGKRKADYHISIYETFSALPNAEEIVAELPKVGWSKAGKMANYVTEENAAQLVQLAQEQTEVKLLETLKTQFTTEGGLNARGKSASHATIKRTTFGPYKLFEDQGAGVEMIINAAAKQTGIQDPAALFEHIVTEWAADHLGEVAAKAKIKVEQTTAKLKKAGVKLPDNHPAATPKTETKTEAKVETKPAPAAPAAKPAVKTLAKR